MFSFLKGTIVSKQLNTPFGTFLILDVNNVGYSILVNRKTLSNLPSEGSQVTIFTQLIHKEDTMYLCGFITLQERDLFNFLQSVSGIGVKVAMNLLSELEPLEIVTAVIKQDYKVLAKTKGIGPKIAQRIVLELKDKMTSWRPAFEEEKKSKSEFKQIDSYIETESVLLSLGYSSEETKEALEVAIKKAAKKEDSEELIQLALKWLSR